MQNKSVMKFKKKTPFITKLQQLNMSSDKRRTKFTGMLVNKAISTAFCVFS